jgi:hypothetical protein
MRTRTTLQWLYGMIGFCVTLTVNAQTHEPRMIFSDEFETEFDTAVWAAELHTLPGSKVSVQQGKLVLDTQGGVTVWLKKKLQGNIEITYSRKVVMAGGKNDRLSDLNQFWMATDPRNENLFTRNGRFEEYDSLQLYYVGMGGNSNTTIRFRKYTGSGERTLIGEFSDAAHLLKPDYEYHIRIVVHDGIVEFFVDGKCYFNFEDVNVLKEGYFGFRSTASHQEIDDVRIYELR